MQRKRWAGWLFVALAACGGSTVETEPVTGDAGRTPERDGGSPALDGAQGHEGGGTSCGAAGTKTACEPTVVATITTMAGISSIADDATTVYVADNSGTIQAIDVATGATTVLATVGQANADLTLAVGTDDVFFAATDGVSRVSKSGGAVEKLVATPSESGLAAFGGKVFFSEPYLPGVTGGPSGDVLSLPAAGGTPTVLASKVQIDLGMTTDGVSVYWLSGDGDLDAVPVGGGAVQTLATKQYGIGSLAADGVNLYWTEDDTQVGGCGLCPPPPPPTATDSSIWSLSLKGGAATVLAKGYSISIFATDGTDLYWFDAHEDTLSALPVSGGTPTVLARNVGTGVSLLADTNYLYWISSDSKLMRLPKKPAGE